MKKITAVLMALGIVLLSLSACTAKNKVTVNGTRVSSGIYSYFLDREKAADSELSEDEIKAAAQKDVAYYVMINSEFANREMKLTFDDKSKISQNVNNYWHLFSAAYESLGVTKQDLQKIEENKAYKDELIVYYYGENGESPVTDETLKTYFNENYIAFKAITGFFTTVNNDGTAAMLSDSEKAALTESFLQYANAINEGSSIEEVAASLDNINVNSDTVVINRANKSYPDTFFDKVFALEVNKSGSFSIGDYVFIVSRGSLEDEQDSLFKTYKTDCLKALKGEEFDSITNGWAEAYAASVK